MALVITLILLAVITTLAIAFLALTYRETAGVDSLARTTDSEMAADSALERAKAEILAPFARNDTNRFSLTTNGVEIMGPDFMVSVPWDTNRLVSQGMFRNPSPPVFINTNRPNGPPNPPFEDRFFLDLNRNRFFEETGYVQDTDDSFRLLANQFNWRVGDPQWVGVLQDPRRPHTNDNRFIFRYAYLVQPIGRSLDVNWIHNQALVANEMHAGVSGFYRNQGVGTWELNLAGFLADLNANYWGGYVFDPFNPVFPNSVARGVAFNDARELLQYRYSPRLYNGTPWDLFTPQTSPHRSNDTFNALAPNPFVAAIFRDDRIDGYADSPVQPDGRAASVDDDNTSEPWPGADSRRHFFSVHDLLDGNKLPGPSRPSSFTNNLMLASQRGNSHDRYSYYRMLAQLGTDSEAEREDEGKININYVNIPSWKDGVRYPPTNLWSQIDAEFTNRMGRPGPELFFLTVVTNLLLREPELAFIVTNARPPALRNAPFGIPLRIPIFINGSTITTNLPMPGPLYSGRIHQILQQAANIHDATTGPKDFVNFPRGEGMPYFPSVFRPQFEFESGSGNVYITDYTLVTGPASTIVNSTEWYDLDAFDHVVSSSGPSPPPVPPSGATANIYGIPLIIGARKGFPNFNEVAVATIVEMVRRLDVRRTAVGENIRSTNQTLEVRMFNQVGVEARNSYAGAYPRQLDLFFRLRSKSVATNRLTGVAGFPWTNWITGYATSYVASSWTGNANKQASTSYRFSPTLGQTILSWTNVSAPDSGFLSDLNYWGLAVTNRMLFFLVDGPSGRIVDAVSLNGPRRALDITDQLKHELPNKGGRNIARLWQTGRDEGYKTSIGVANQIKISTSINQSTSPNRTTDQEWIDYGNGTPSKIGAITNFLDVLSNNERVGTFQVPFTPRLRIILTNYLQVNDPLVHFTMEDLASSSSVTNLEPSQSTNALVILGNGNPRSISWANGGNTSDSPGLGSLNPTLRDPGVFGSDSWDFPTNLFANIGWLGRVHRGTPWQTIYLKSEPPTENWPAHSGPSREVPSANFMAPPKDWDLLDIFTTAPHPNATRGRLSINQTNLAAWSAVLAGVVTSSTQDDPDLGPAFPMPQSIVVQPAAVSNEVEQIVIGINHRRTNYANGEFKRLGDLLSVPELTYDSPHLNTAAFNARQPAPGARITDADYERIPQQILSLVKLGEPRFVVYSWGQSLKPARRNPEDTGPSIVTSGPERGLCRNYQITGEMATRAVIRVEFDRITDPFSPQFNQLDYSRPRAVVESFNLLPVE